MRFFQVLLSGAALIAAALAVEFNSVPSSIEPGKTYTITWSPKEGTVSLILRQGDPSNLNTLQTITSMSLTRLRAYRACMLTHVCSYRNRWILPVDRPYQPP